jgi:hypothetical protein
VPLAPGIIAIGEMAKPSVVLAAVRLHQVATRRLRRQKLSANFAVASGNEQFMRHVINGSNMKTGHDLRIGRYSKRSNIEAD